MKALLFDLDDTLFLEGEFVASGYGAVARYVERMFGCSFREVFLAMMTSFAESGRESVLAMVSERFTGGRMAVSEMVQLYRHHRPRIRLLPGYALLLRRLGRRFRMGILTDGLPSVQRNKVRALGLHRLVDAVIYTWEFGSCRQKPHPVPFERLLRRMGIAAQQALFVGDSLEKDGLGAAGVGMRFVHVRNGRTRPRGGFRSGVRPLSSVDSLFQLPPLLESLN